MSRVSLQPQLVLQGVNRVYILTLRREWKTPSWPVEGVIHSWTGEFAKPKCSARARYRDSSSLRARLPERAAVQRGELPDP